MLFGFNFIYDLKKSFSIFFNLNLMKFWQFRNIPPSRLIQVSFCAVLNCRKNSNLLLRVMRDVGSFRKAYFQFSKRTSKANNNNSMLHLE